MPKLDELRAYRLSDHACAEYADVHTERKMIRLFSYL